MCVVAKGPKRESRAARRQRLQEADLWYGKNGFLELVKRLKAEKGYTSNDKAYRDGACAHLWPDADAPAPSKEHRAFTPPSPDAGSLGVFPDGTEDRRKRKRDPDDLDPADFAGKPATTVYDDVLWAYNHLYVQDADRTCDPPSIGAVIWYRYANKNKPAMEKFLQDIVAKLLPSRSELEVKHKHRDDGRDLRDRVASILERVGSN